MNLRLRTPVEQDWPAISRAADASLPWQIQGNQQWLRNRMNFDDRKLLRRHYVAENSDSGEVCGYGSVEGGPAPDRCRVFVVTAAALLPSVGEALLARLLEDLKSLAVKTAWVREEARDLSVLDFFRRHGFASEREFTTEQGLRVVTLERDITAAISP
jgi:N-acetylglutamate synthase-like GNAT family acetyltransferase